MHTSDNSNVSAQYEIALATESDLPYLPSIELAAARMLAGHAPASVLDETTGVEALASFLALGHLWVARNGGTPIGFVYVKLIEPNTVHLDEIDVHPAHGRRGVGRRLVRTVCEFAVAHGRDAVTLSTFRAVPWNMPFYASMGFVEMPQAALSPGLRAIVDNEARRGLDTTRRLVMRRTVSDADR